MLMVDWLSLMSLFLQFLPPSFSQTCKTYSSNCLLIALSKTFFTCPWLQIVSAGYSTLCIGNPEWIVVKDYIDLQQNLLKTGRILAKDKRKRDIFLVENRWKTDKRWQKKKTLYLYFSQKSILDPLAIEQQYRQTSRLQEWQKIQKLQPTNTFQ